MAFESTLEVQAHRAALDESGRHRAVFFDGHSAVYADGPRRARYLPNTHC